MALLSQDPQLNNETFCFLAILSFFNFTLTLIDFGWAGAALEAPLPETYSECTNTFVMSLVSGGCWGVEGGGGWGGGGR